MKVLVTGATSRLGIETVAALLRQGHTPVAFQRRPAHLGIEEHLGDIADADAVLAAARGVDAVVHLAARVSPVGAWELFEAANVAGTANVVAACRHNGAVLVHVSTPSVAPVGHGIIGGSAAPATTENPANYYVASKARAEIDALDANRFDLPVVAIRPHLVWGPGDTQLVGRIVDRAREGRLVLIGNGASLIDTTWVENAADSLVAALARIEVVRGRALVVTNGEPRPVAEILERLCAAYGVAGPRWRVPKRVAQVAGTVVDSVWERSGRTDDPPATRFLADELAHPHWFDQRETRELLDWSPAVTLDAGFAKLAESAARPD